MKVLSCFDGISCGQVALERAGIPVTQYYASEIDKHAIKVTQKNYPKTIQLGDIKNVVKLTTTGLIDGIDILMGGSPCQGFSNAGKGLGFTDPRSMLFYDFLMLKNILKPKWFLLENVKMKKQDMDIITGLMGVEPVLINSADFSAQNRKRMYWTNVPIAEWVDRGIVLRDILETDDCCNDVGQITNVNPSGRGMNGRVFGVGGKSPTLLHGKGDAVKLGKSDLSKYILNRTPSREKMWADGKGVGGKYSCVNLSEREKSNTITTKQDRFSNTGLVRYQDFCRYVTPIECERLQTLPDNYTAGISDTQRYKALGNGWTVDVIAHIFKGIHNDPA